MGQKGEIRKFTGAQRIAVQLLREKISAKMKEANTLIEKQNTLLNEIGKDMNIPKEEFSDWHLTEKKDGFEYRPKDKPNKNIPKGKGNKK